MAFTSKKRKTYCTHAFQQECQPVEQDRPLHHRGKEAAELVEGVQPPSEAGGQVLEDLLDLFLRKAGGAGLVERPGAVLGEVFASRRQLSYAPSPAVPHAAAEEEHLQGRAPQERRGGKLWSEEGD